MFLCEWPKLEWRVLVMVSFVVPGRKVHQQPIKIFCDMFVR